MKQRTAVMSLSIFGIILGTCIAMWTAFGPDEVRLPRERIQTLIDQQLPYERDNVVVSNATVEFKGDELTVNVDVKGERLKQPFSLSAKTIGVPTYRNGSFYFAPSGVEFKDIVVGTKDAKSVTDRVREGAKRFFPNNEGAQNAITDLAPGIEVWVRDRTIKAAGSILSNVPVYTLPNDAKGLAAKAVLGGVYVENDELVITFTLWRLTWWVLAPGFAILGSIAMLVAMIRSPGMFVGAMVLTSGL